MLRNVSKHIIVFIALVFVSNIKKVKKPESGKDLEALMHENEIIPVKFIPPILLLTS